MKMYRKSDRKCIDTRARASLQCSLAVIVMSHAIDNSPVRL